MKTPACTRKENLFQIIFITAVASLGGFLFGYDSGVINGAVGALQTEFNSNSVGTGFNVASILLGCMVGAGFSGYFADRFGRRPVMIVMCLIFGISAIGSGLATSSGEFVIYRLIGGFGVGAASAICPAYISEIAPLKIRGMLIGCQQMAIVLGIFCAFLANYMLADLAGGSMGVIWFDFKAWQWMFWTLNIPTLLFFCGLMLVPESPRYLVGAKKYDKAESVISKIFGGDAKSELEAIKKSLRDEKPSFREVFKANSFNFHAIIWVGIALAFFQQTSGINIIFYYGEVLWRSIGFDENTALEQNVITGGVNVVFTIVALALVDKVGRKKLLLIGSVLMATALACMAALFSTGSMADGVLQLPGMNGKLAFACAIVYVCGFCISWGPILWVLLGEMFPNTMRASGIAICADAVWLSNFAVTMLFPSMLAKMGLCATYGIYATFALLSFFFVLKFVRETNQVALEEMKSD